MDGFCHNVLPGACLSGDEHGGVREHCDLNELQDIGNALPADDDHAFLFILALVDHDLLDLFKLQGPERLLHGQGKLLEVVGL